MTHDNTDESDDVEFVLTDDLARELFLEFLREHEESDQDFEVSTTQLLKSAVLGEGYRFTGEELETIEDISPAARREYDAILEGEFIEYTGPSLDELMDR